MQLCLRVNQLVSVIHSESWLTLLAAVNVIEMRVYSEKCNFMLLPCALLYHYPRKVPSLVIVYYKIKLFFSILMNYSFLFSLDMKLLVCNF